MQGAVVKLAGKFPAESCADVSARKTASFTSPVSTCGRATQQNSAAWTGCATPQTVVQPVGIKTTKTGVTLTFTADRSRVGDRSPKLECRTLELQVDRSVRLRQLLRGRAGKRGKGGDLVLIDEIKVSENKRSITLNLPDMGPVHQMKFKYRLKSADGKELSNEVYHTIYRLSDGALSQR
jgi:hypothetical protein